MVKHRIVAAVSSFGCECCCYNNIQSEYIRRHDACLPINAYVRQRDRERERDKERERETDRQTDKQTERQRERERDRESERPEDRGRERELD